MMSFLNGTYMLLILLAMSLSFLLTFQVMAALSLKFVFSMLLSLNLLSICMHDFLYLSYLSLSVREVRCRR